MEALKEYETPAQRFVQMYNFMATKMRFLRVIRDAYDIMFNMVVNELDTLGCELDCQLKISKTLEAVKGSVGDGSLIDIRPATLDTISNESILRFVNDARTTSWTGFKVLCDAMKNYITECRGDLASLSEYDITASSEIKSQFKQFGNIFSAAGMYTHPDIVQMVDELRTTGTQDDAGFIMRRNTYFKGVSAGITYYVHWTGRMLAQLPNGKYEPKSFDFSSESDIHLYAEIIDDGKAQNAR
jgi:hypothetical protein